MTDPKVAELAVEEVARFCAAAIRRAGGERQLAERLSTLGFRGRQEGLTAGAVRAWRLGVSVPGADVVFALAAVLGLSLDRTIGLDDHAPAAGHRQTLREAAGS
jgi:transcriptional regulator with XRE-family HTH domain